MASKQHSSTADSLNERLFLFVCRGWSYAKLLSVPIDLLRCVFMPTFANVTSVMGSVSQASSYDPASSALQASRRAAALL